LLHLIKDNQDLYFSHLSEDPVRSNIPPEIRIGKNKEVFVLIEEETLSAITCVSYLESAPSCQQELFDSSESPRVAVFYSIWNYKPNSGSGKRLILQALDYIQKAKPEITRWVTLSPKTELARSFHLKNGAIIFRENEDSINYEYYK